MTLLGAIRPLLRAGLVGGSVVVLGGGVAACGDEDEPVAKVGDQEITRSQFEHWYRLAVKYPALAQLPGEPPPIAPDPPTYARCIAAKRAELLPAERQRASATALRARCRLDEAELRRQTMNLLLEAASLESQAERLGVKVTDAELEQEFLRWRADNGLADERALQEHYRVSGMTKEDVLFRLRNGELARRILARAAKDDLTKENLTRHYRRNKQRFKAVAPARRIQILTARMRAQAEAAKLALAEGTSWEDAIKRYASSKTDAGAIGISRADKSNPDLSRAVWSAPEGRLVGPFKVRQGQNETWDVIRVVRDISGEEHTVIGYWPLLEGEVLSTPRVRRKLARFYAELRRRTRAETTCERGYEVAEYCGDASVPVARSGGT